MLNGYDNTESTERQQRHIKSNLGRPQITETCSHERSTGSVTGGITIRLHSRLFTFSIKKDAVKDVPRWQNGDRWVKGIHRTQGMAVVVTALSIVDWTVCSPIRLTSQSPCPHSAIRISRRCNRPAHVPVSVSERSSHAIPETSNARCVISGSLRTTFGANA